jgi:hypothetical protein
MDMKTHPEQGGMPRTRDAESGQFTESYPLAVFLDALRSEEGMASTPEVASVVGCSDRLALNRLQDLANKGRVTRRKVGNANLWILADNL